VKKSRCYTFFLTVSLLFLSLFALGQGKVAVSIANPSAFELCIPSDYVEIEIRNITTSTVTGLLCELKLPTGVNYIAGSINSTQASEQNITNLNKPLFSISNLAITQAAVLKVRLAVDCDIISFLNNGGLAQIESTTSYSGGTVGKSSSPFNVKQPSLQITSITNQLKTADLQEVFVRVVTLKNSGTGRLSNATFWRRNQSGLQLISAQGGTITYSGDTIFSTLDSAAFVSIGNSDKYFDLNETITLTDTLKVIACSNLATTYRAYWGCNNKVCSSTASSANVSISTKSPDIVITTNASTSNCLNGTLLDQQAVLYNKGSDTARAVDFHVFNAYSSGYYNYILTEIVTSSFRASNSVSGTGSSIVPYKTNYTYNLGAYSCLSSNPPGEVFYIFPDMAPGDSIVIKWQTKSCCPQTCNATNFYFQRWKCEVAYKNQCDKTLKSGEVWGSTGLYQGNTISKFVPTDIQDGETKQLEYTFSNGYLLNPISSSLTKVQIILSSGLSHTKTAADLKFAHPNGTSWSPNYFTQNGDTITAYFKGAPTVTLVRGELLINVKGNCSGVTANKNAPYTVNIFYNADTTCSSNCDMPIYCNADVLRIHCAASCGAGMHFNGFSAKRISYGEPDNDNDGVPDASGSLDFDKIKLNRIMYGDTMLATYKGKVYNAGSITNWYFGKATSTIEYGYYLDVADVRIKIYRQGNLLFNCNNIIYSSSVSGYNKTFSFDISYNNLVNSGCSLYSAFAYLNVDSVELEVTYVVAKNPGNASRELKMTNNFYLSSVANPTSSQIYQCDTFSSRVNLNGSFYLNYANDIINNSGCNSFNANQNFYLSIGQASGNYAGGNLFPYEYRKWARIKEITVKKDAGFDLTNAAIIQYRTKGTGATAWERYLSIKPYSVTSTELKFRIDSLYTDLGGNIKISDDGFYGTFTTSWLANCNAKTETTNLSYDFVFEGQGILSANVDTLASGIYTDKISYVAPEILVTTANASVYAETDTVTWVVRLTNNSQIADVSYLWATAKQNGNTKLVEVIDTRTNSKMPKYNDVFLMGTLSENEIRTFKVRATYNNCDFDSILFELGSNCKGYPDSAASYYCNTLKTPLYFEPINTRLEAIMLDTSAVVDLCEERDYTIEIRNTGSPKVFNTYLDLLLRPGMVLNDTAWLRVEGRTDSVAITNPTNISANTYRWNLSAQDSVLNASGLNGVKSSTGYIMNLRFKLTTDCNFTSSTFFLLRPGGSLRCGKPVNAAYTVGEPIDIKGVVKPYYSAVSLEMPHLDACNFNGTTYIKFINLGPDTTGINDRIIVSLPPGIQMDTNYTSTGYNAATTKAKFKLVNGENTYSWFLPSGISVGDSSLFTIKPILINNVLDCGLKQVFTQAVITQPVLCVSSNTYCDINVATSAALTVDSVEKSSFTIFNVGASAVPSGTKESISLNYSLANSGANKSNGDGLKVDLYFDTNQNGIVDSGDVYLQSDTVLAGIAKGSNYTQSLNFDVSSAFVCNLLLYISESNCVCDAAWASIPPPRLINAGTDTIACPGEPFAIGKTGSASNTYSWSPSSYAANPDSAQTIFNGLNTKTVNDTIIMILTTNRSGCSSNDSVNVILHPGMSANFADTVNLCKGDRTLIGDLISGGVGRVKTYQWTPTDSLTKPQGILPFANPIVSTNYVFKTIDNAGCTYFDSTYVKVIERPEAVMTFIDTCANEFVKLSNISNYKGTVPDSLHWNFGTIYESQLNNFQVYVDSAQQIKVDLYVQNSDKCWDTTSGLVTVYPLPAPDVIFYEDCEFDTTTLQTNSTILYGSLTHKWVIDLDTFNGNLLNYTLGSGTSLPFKLTANSDRGCKTTLYDTITMRNKPDISVSLANKCLVDSVGITATIGASTTEPITNYAWNLGDGTNSNLANFNYKYADTGTYTVQLVVATAFGCADTTSAQVAIYPMPKSAFTSQNICLTETAEFNDQSSVNSGNIAKIYWDFGSGFVLGDTNISLTRNQPGTYAISQKVETNFGCADSSTQNFDVYYVEYPKIIIQGNCQNKAISINANPKFNDSISAIKWYILTDSFATNGFAYNFPNAGNFTLRQVITTNRGCRSDSTFIVKVDSAPIATLNYNKICDDNVVDFSGNGLTNSWNLGDGTVSANAQFQHTYASLGTYNVQLAVTNKYNCKDTTTEDVVIDNLVIPDFEVRDICRDESQWVYNTTSGFGSPISSAIFTMGDGNTRSSLDSFEYTYTIDGLYTINLKVTTIPGCEYSTSKNIQVYPLPRADFKIFPETADIFTSNIQISDKSNGADSVTYFLSDGNTYSVFNFEHKFKDSGSYDIKQWVTSAFGCQDSITKSLYITFAYKLFIPNAFSPNGDGLNDEFKPIGYGLKDFEMDIYNRWGELVFRSKKPNETWTGENALPGYYMYMIKAYDFQKNFYNYKGGVYLVR